MRRRLAMLGWWLSRAAATLGVVLAVAFVALDVRSRWVTDWLDMARVAPGAATGRYDWLALNAITGDGRLAVQLSAGTVDAEFGAQFLAPGRVWRATVHQRDPRMPGFSWVTPRPAAWRRWLSELGLHVETNRTTDRAIVVMNVVFPPWLLAVVSALPAAALLFRRWRRRRRGDRGFTVVLPGDGSAAETDETGGRP